MPYLCCCCLFHRFSGLANWLAINPEITTLVSIFSTRKATWFSQGMRACMHAYARASDRAHHAVNGCCKTENFAIISLKLTITAWCSHSKVHLRHFTEINDYRLVFSFQSSFEAFALTNCVFVVCIQIHFNVFVLISYQKWHHERKSI